MKLRLAFLLAGLFGAGGVALGAYAAHPMEKRLQKNELPEKVIRQRIENAQIAVRYQLPHGIALLVLAGLGSSQLATGSRCLAAAQWLLVVGIVLFCGGLTLHALAGTFGHWAIVPAGGLTLILAWSCVVVHAIFCWNPVN